MYLMLFDYSEMILDMITIAMIFRSLIVGQCEARASTMILFFFPATKNPPKIHTPRAENNERILSRGGAHSRAGGGKTPRVAEIAGDGGADRLKAAATGHALSGAPVYAMACVYAEI